MKRVYFHPSVIEARIFDKGSPKERAPYLGSFVIHLIELGEVAEITLLTGICREDSCAWDMEIDKEVQAYLLSLGVKRVRYEHKGKMVNRNLG